MGGIRRVRHDSSYRRWSRRDRLRFDCWSGSSGIDAWNLLETNGRATFTRITVERGIIFVVATQLLATAQPEEVLLMLREVAQVADQLEHEFFQKDEF
jgi:hypothetical protein